MIGDCFKKKNMSAVGVPQSPKHPSNDSTPIAVPSNSYDRNYFEIFAFTKTCAFEGSGYNNVTDNFDGQGISLGGLQWCVGQGSLQAKILKPYFNTNLPNNITEQILLTISVSDIKTGLSLCKKNFLVGTKLKPEVRKDLEAFALKAKDYQMNAVKDLFAQAWDLCRLHDMNTLKSFCFFFDICVQNGSLNDIPKPAFDFQRYLKFINEEGGKNRNLWLSSAVPVDEETIVLALWACDRIKHNKWREDVIARKCTIAHGKGTVHGTLFSFPEFK